MKSEKKEFASPKIEIMEFAADDVLTTSGGIVLPDDEW